MLAIGRPIHPDISIEVRGENGTVLKNGLVGDLYYSTPFGMEGYLLNNGSIEPASEWQSSEDLVCQDDSGILFWVGRKTQSIKINGTFVNINLLHSFFDELPNICYSYFLYEETINAVCGFFVVNINAHKSTLEQEIFAQFRNQFPDYPRLSSIHFIDEIPKTRTGKINVQLLRDLAAR